jgi:hypothetical protein
MATFYFYFIRINLEVPNRYLAFASDSRGSSGKIISGNFDYFFTNPSLSMSNKLNSRTLAESEGLDLWNCMKSQTWKDSVERKKVIALKKSVLIEEANRYPICVAMLPNYLTPYTGRHTDKAGLK